MQFIRLLSSKIRIKPVITLAGISLLAQQSQAYYNAPKWNIMPRDNSIFIESDDLSKEPQEIKQEVEQASRESTTRGSANIWVKLQINKINHLHLFVSEFGFDIHHATKEYVMLIKQCKRQDIPGEKVSPFPSHCAGSGGIVINEKNEILLVREKKGPRSVTWGFPGGRVDLGESMQDAAVREVKEETGLICEPRDLLLFREMDKALYNRPDIYFLTLLRPISSEIKLCQDEIAESRWVQISELENLLNDPNVKFFPIQRYAIQKLFNLYQNGFDFQNDSSVKSFVMSHNSSNYNIYMPTRGFL